MSGAGETNCLGTTGYHHEFRSKFRCIDSLRPEKVSKREGSIQRIFMAEQSVMAITTKGQMYTWGDGEEGTLGHGDFKKATRPKKVSYFLEHMREEGGVPVSANRCAMGKGHVIVIDAVRGATYTWGSNQYGQLGQSSFDHTQRHQPQSNNYSYNQYNLKELRDRREAFGIGFDVQAVACGKYHTMLLTNAGHVFVWGGGPRGALGLPEPKAEPGVEISFFNKPKINPIHTPRLVEELAHTRVTQIVAGGESCYCLTENDDVWAWGSNQSGQLGINERSKRIVWTPMKVDNLSGKGIVKLVAGDEHAAAILKDGTVMTWGKNRKGQCGLKGPKLKVIVLEPRVVPNITNVKMVDCGLDYTFVVCDADEEESIMVEFGGDENQPPAKKQKT